MNPGTYYINVYANAPANAIGCGNGDYWVNLQCQPCQPCPQCDPGMVMENEPCPNNPDYYNSGCGPDFLTHVLPVNCGDRICGTGASNGIYDDVDVYEINTTGYDSLVWCVVPNFLCLVTLTQPLAPCGPSILYGSVSGGPCDTLCVGQCLPPGRYWLTIRAYGGGIFCNLDQYTAEVRCVPCIPCAPCPAGAIVENEPCPGQLDNINGGCSSPTQATIPVTCGATVCGTGIMLDSPVNDFYSITLTTIDSLVWCATADFPFSIGIYSPAVTCPAMVTFAQTNSPACVPACVSACLPPGTYWLRIAATGALNYVCKPYVANVHCYPCTTPISTCPYPSQDIETLNNTCGTGLPQFNCPDTLCGVITNGAGAVDVDWYEINLPGPNCSNFRLDCYGNGTPGWFPFGQGLNPRVSLWKSDCSTILNFDDNSGVANDARMDSPCLQPGSYRLKVQGVGGTFGPYILTMTCNNCICPCDIGCGHLPLDGEVCPNLTSPDSYNGGCTTGGSPPPFGTMLCNTSFCAQSFAMGGIVDHDWYVLNLTAARRIYWFVTAEFPFQIQVYRPVPDCSSLTLLRNKTGNPCDTKFAWFKCLAAGTYYFHVAPTVSTAVPCSEYTSRLLCGKCFITDVIFHPVNPASTSLRLSWSPDETAPVFNIYRSTNSGLDTNPMNLIGSTSDTTFVDPEIIGNPSPLMFYIVAMQDADSTGGD